MSSNLKRVQSATGTVALVVALLALIASAAGVGYAAGQIGTKDIANSAITAKKIKKNAVTTKKVKNNAITATKIKDGSLTAADLVAEEKQVAVTAYGNGTEGDCVWQSAVTTIPGTSGPTFRKNRFGQVVLSGIAASIDGPGGDADCDAGPAGQTSDGIAFILPAAYVPAKSQLFPGQEFFGIVVGAQGLTVPGAGALPPGAVYNGDGVVVLDSIVYEPAGSSLVAGKTRSRGSVDPGLLAALGLG